jgi:hypothetical protein
MGMYFEDFEDAGEFVTAAVSSPRPMSAIAELSGDRTPST